VVYLFRYTRNMSAAELISSRRRELGLSQGQLAELTATSRERINTYERGHVSPRTDTLARVMQAMQVDLAAIPAMTFEERRSIALSTAVAEKLRSDPTKVIAKARENIASMRLVGRHEQPWVDVWESLLDLGPGPVGSLLTSADQFARDLRQSSPFAGVLTEDERRRAVSGLRR
jgi:transcriptional regulator with XRE-family HTH domain